MYLALCLNGCSIKPSFRKAQLFFHSTRTSLTNRIGGVCADQLRDTTRCDAKFASQGRRAASLRGESAQILSAMRIGCDHES